MLNVITAKFCSGATQTWTDEAYQWDYGQVLVIEGVDLPDAYEVHFSNTPIKGDSKTQIGGADGVTIPDEYFLSGDPIYVWIFRHQGEDDGETEKMITIPVKKRPQPSDDVPSPVEQSAIDQAIAALNVAVDKAEDAIEHYPRIQDGTWWVWDVTTETWVDTGVQAQGRPGTDGEDGFSPVITVTDITGGHRVTITDAEGTQTVDVMNGQPGTPGYSPTVAVTEITGGHRVTITDAQGSHVFDVMDGSDASVTVDDELSDTSENPVQNKTITGAVNQINEDITDLQDALDGKVDDVQVNGVSVVRQGVANIPVASATDFGTVKVPVYTPGKRGGIFTLNGVVVVVAADNNEIKSGSDLAKPLCVYNTDAVTFYGLAKASGDDTQRTSSNPVGTYTDSAKVAIQKMLGIYESPWELIREDTVTNATAANIDIDVDGNGNPFELTDLRLIFSTPQQTTDASVGSPGRVRFYVGTVNYDIAYLEGYTQTANTQARTGIVSVEQTNGMIQRTAIQSTGNNSNAQIRGRNQINVNDRNGIWELPQSPRIYSKVTIEAVTGTAQYKLYGRRKWS